MEEDRLETNLGPTAEDDLSPEISAALKQPKRRFVGRKTAEQQAGKAGPESSIEQSSSALQGAIKSRSSCISILILPQ
jgi:2-(3-amino-3-carboxypropyl)histidine synthase